MHTRRPEKLIKAQSFYAPVYRNSQRSTQRSHVDLTFCSRTFVLEPTPSFQLDGVQGCGLSCRELKGIEGCLQEGSLSRFARPRNQGGAERLVKFCHLSTRSSSWRFPSGQASRLLHNLGRLRLASRRPSIERCYLSVVLFV
jgi:hypothetical protein